jgi:MerR family transcriptional regulator, heat shock protein HspR
MPRRPRRREDEAPKGGERAEQDRESEDRERGVYMISVAAELAGMHPQTLRIYEARGLITPKRSPKNTRLYSQEDVERLQRIQELTGELGMNLAGVERAFELEREIERLRRRMRALERQADKIRGELQAELERVRRSFRRELVVWEPPEKTLLPARRPDGAPFQIRVRRR